MQPRRCSAGTGAGLHAGVCHSRTAIRGADAAVQFRVTDGYGDSGAWVRGSGLVAGGQSRGHEGYRVPVMDALRNRGGEPQALGRALTFLRPGR